MSDLLKAIDDLTAALEASNHTVTAPLEPKPDMTYGGLIQTTDQMAIANPFLTDESKLLLSQRCHSQVIQTPTETYISSYLAKVVKEHEIPAYVEKIALLVNRLVEQGLIYKTLAPIQSIKLSIIPKYHGPIAVTCFVLTPVSREKEVRALCGDFFHDERSIMGEPKSFYKELPPGQFYAEDVRETFAASLITGRREGDFIHRTIEEYLSILPVGTKVISVRKCDIRDLSLPYEVIFYNPDLPSIKEVGLRHIRHMEFVGDSVNGRFKQLDLLVGVTYTLRDGLQLKG